MYVCYLSLIINHVHCFKDYRAFVCLHFHAKLLSMSTNAIEGFKNVSQCGRISYEFGFILFNVVEIVAGSLFNSLVILVLIFNRRLLEIPANVILLSLAISDLFACSMVLPYHLYEILNLRETLVHQALLLFSMTVGMFGIVLLTGDRFMAIVWPLRYNRIVSLSRTRFVLVANWLFSFLHAVMYCVAGRYKIKGIRYLIALVNFGAVLAILILYGIIFRAACRQIRLIHDRRQVLRSVGFIIFRRTLKSAKSCGSIVLFFAVTYLPVCINSIFYEMRKVAVSFFNERTAWLLALVYLNCSLNPLLYCAFSSNLRAIICKTLRCVWRWLLRKLRAFWQRLSRASHFQQSDRFGGDVEMSSAFSIVSVDQFCNANTRGDIGSFAIPETM